MKQYILLGMTFGLLVGCSAKTSSKMSPAPHIGEDGINAQSYGAIGRDTIDPQAPVLLPSKNNYKLNEAFSTDRDWVNAILADAVAYNKEHEIGDVVIFIARKFIGKPYVAHTLDRTDDEQMVINLQELDCTTYLENVIALVLTSYEPTPDYTTFVDVLRNIRYRNGEVGYDNRLHYFDWWMSNNGERGFIKEILPPDKAMLMRQTLKINYMSENASAYTMLKNHPERVQAIKKLEDETNGKVITFIPKQRLNNPVLRKVIKNGDLIALVTSKKNLDTTHLGFAIWKNDGLHLLNASSLKKNSRRVVEPGETLYQYLMERPWNTGIRVARVCTKTAKPGR